MSMLVKNLKKLLALIRESNTQLEWGGWRTTMYEGVSTIEPKHLLLITIRRFRVTSGSKHAGLVKGYMGPLTFWQYAQEFDPKKHLHVYRLTVQDPLNRWDERRLCDVWIDPQDDTLFENLSTLFEKISESAHYPQKMSKDPLVDFLETL